MLARSRRVVAALSALLAVTAAPTAAFGEGHFRAAAANSNSVSDAKGDVKNDDGSAAAQPEADIVAASAEDRGADIAFTVLVDRPTDPTTTKNWESGTGATWLVDTNGDNTPEYLVAFGRDEKGQPAVQAAALDQQGGAGCAGTAGRGPNGEYVATVPASCLGNPASFRYAASMSWDTDPANDNAPSADDSAPDNNLAGPVAKP